MTERSASAEALRYATLAFGLVIAGAAVFGLGRTLGPSADQHAESTSARLDLSLLVPGEPILFEYDGSVVWVLRLTDAQITATRETEIAELLDPLARNAMRPPDAPATFENRTIGTEDAIVVMNARCDRNGFVAVYNDIEDDTWFCMRGAEEYDALGRRLRTNGLGIDSFEIPPHTVTEDGHLVMLSAAEHVLYGTGN